MVDAVAPLSPASSSMCLPKENKYSSFQRQLNLYGFRKLVRGNEAGGYMHPLFERGKPEQLSQVRRGFFPEVIQGHSTTCPTLSKGVTASKQAVCPSVLTSSAGRRCSHGRTSLVVGQVHALELYSSRVYALILLNAFGTSGTCTRHWTTTVHPTHCQDHPPTLLPCCLMWPHIPNAADPS